MTASAVLVPSLPYELPGSAAGRAGGAEAHGSRSHARAASILKIVFTLVNKARFCTGMTTLLRDPWGGLSLVPLITSIICLFSVDNLIAGVRKTRETLYRHFITKINIKHKQT